MNVFKNKKKTLAK